MMATSPQASSPLTNRQVLQALRARGFVVRLDGARLQIGPAEHVTRDLAQRLAPRKAGIIDLLRREQHAIDLGHAVGATQATFPGATVEGDSACLALSWEAWKTRTRTWWPDLRPHERLERACEILPHVIDALMLQDDPAPEARARYCWGRMLSLCEEVERRG